MTISLETKSGDQTKTDLNAQKEMTTLTNTTGSVKINHQVNESPLFKVLNKKMTTFVDTIANIKIDHLIKEPPMFRVIYLDDDITTMEFVMNSLVEIFDHDFETAQDLTLDVHCEGRAVVAVLPYPMAEEKAESVRMAARKEGYPFKVVTEKVDD